MFAGQAWQSLYPSTGGLCEKLFLGHSKQGTKPVGEYVPNPHTGMQSWIFFDPSSLV